MRRATVALRSYWKETRCKSSGVRVAVGQFSDDGTGLRAGIRVVAKIRSADRYGAFKPASRRQSSSPSYLDQCMLTLELEDVISMDM